MQLVKAPRGLGLCPLGKLWICALWPFLRHIRKGTLAEGVPNHEDS